ncbi:MAG: carboxypeptidase-like regulatory domain-containing protein, partial [Bacteroidetes bacterium]|nr:carboxypeptidase-like regulatory domain-containing protein [Fibrella sp.]
MKLTPTRAAFVGLLLLVGVIQAQSQSVIRGRVLDASTNKPLPFATVYINASMLGTTADGDGQYQLTGLPTRTVEVVASSVGFKTLRHTLRIGNEPVYRLSFALVPDVNALQTVTVTAKRTGAYDRMVRQFKRELLGDTPFADKCLITNLKSVSLTVSDGQLRASATEPLVIENKALGYRLYYDLTYFDTYRRATHYAGTSRFEGLTSENAEQAERWDRNRQKAYQGSVRHLLTTLIAGTHEQEGFLVYKATFNAPANPDIPIAQMANALPTNPVRSDSLVTPATLPSERRLFSAKPLEVFYTRQRAISSPYKAMPYPYSLVYMPTGKAAIVTTDGWIVQPNGLEVRGAMSNDRLATLLPADWQPAGQSDKQPLPRPAEGTVLPPDSLINAVVTRWADGQQNATPSVFLHLDKGLYATGDRLWFSGYVLNPATYQPTVPGETELEPALHVELVAPNGRLLHQWARVREGRASGSFRLSDSLATGTYRLRAYSGADANQARPAFERTITVVSGIRVRAEPKPTDVLASVYSVDVQFLPEGGHWVVGLLSRLGIKAVDKQGRGIAGTGRVLTASGVDVARFVLNRFGMGSVELTPQPNERYKAELLTTAGQTIHSLPVPDSTGLVLAVDAVTDSTQLRIHVRAS